MIRMAGIRMMRPFAAPGRISSSVGDRNTAVSKTTTMATARRSARVRCPVMIERHFGCRDCAPRPNLRHAASRLVRMRSAVARPGLSFGPKACLTNTTVSCNSRSSFSVVGDISISSGASLSRRRLVNSARWSSQERRSRFTLRIGFFQVFVQRSDCAAVKRFGRLQGASVQVCDFVEGHIFGES